MLETTQRSLADYTTIGLGGPAKRLVQVQSERELADVLDEVCAAGEPVFVLGGGSNVIVEDGGWPGVVLRVGINTWEVQEHDGWVRLTVGAGWQWDELVQASVEHGWAGLACLSGIPGWVGAAPIQNIGAYGHEAADVLTEVHAFDRERGCLVCLAASECGFGYRTSRFRGGNRYVVTGVSLRLGAVDGGVMEQVRYAELARSLGVAQNAFVPVNRVREAVISLRKGKGMVVDPADAESRSAGSFYVNPVVSEAQFNALQQQALRAGVVDDPSAVPHHRVGEQYKLAAAWLIEAAGFRKGQAYEGVAISRKHALALVNRSGTTAQLMHLDAMIRNGVEQMFGIALRREPTLVRSSGVCETHV